MKKLLKISLTAIAAAMLFTGCPNPANASGGGTIQLMRKRALYLVEPLKVRLGYTMIHLLEQLSLKKNQLNLMKAAVVKILQKEDLVRVRVLGLDQALALIQKQLQKVNQEVLVQPIQQ